jgi:septum formation topological specificity factor MinE
MSSRPATEDPARMPYNQLFEAANRDAQQADLFLLRNLLARSYNALQNVAIEARTSGCANAAIESLMRDILTVLEKRPGVVGVQK